MRSRVKGALRVAEAMSFFFVFFVIVVVVQSFFVGFTQNLNGQFMIHWETKVQLRNLLE